MYKPLFINLEKTRVAIFGCGEIGVRRAKLFIDAGSEVTVICKDPTNINLRCNLMRLDIDETNIDIIDKIVSENDIIVVALNDERLSKLISRIALEKRKLVNNAMDYKLGNVIVPLHRGIDGIDIALTSFGVSVEILRRIVSKIENLIKSDTEVKILLNIYRRLKPCIKNVVNDHRKRLELYRAINSDKDFNKYVVQGDEYSALVRALGIIKSYGFYVDRCVNQYQ